jgi:hypothetical protein
MPIVVDISGILALFFKRMAVLTYVTALIQ